MERLLRLEPGRLGLYSQQFLDFARGEPRVRALCGRPPVPFPQSEKPSGVAAAGARRALFDEILAANRAAGASVRALEAGEALGAGRGFAVVTGQQPALLGGPLLSLYKAATAVGLARLASEHLGAPVAAIFWIGADDVDRGEIAATSIVDGRGVFHRFSLPDGVPPPRTMVGGVAPAEYQPALAALESGLGGAPGEPAVRRALAHARERSRDLATFTGALLVALFGDAPFLVLDARSRALRRAGADVFRRYAARRSDVERALDERGRELERAGFGRPISPEATKLCLFATPGAERLRLPEAEAIATMERLVVDDPAALSPNVVLRPILQESLFPNLALVAGPGEAAYLAQLVPAFDLLGVRAPRIYPRLTATIVPAEALALAERSSLPLESVLADPDAARRAARPQRAPALFEEAYARLASDVARDLVAVEDEAHAIDRSLPQLVDASRRNIEARLGRIHRGVLARLAAHEESRMPGLKMLRDFVRPRGKAQEREVNLLELPLLLGEGWRGRLEDAVHLHVEALEAGAPTHVAFPAGPLSPRSRFEEAAHG